MEKFGVILTVYFVYQENPLFNFFKHGVTKPRRKLCLFSTFIKIIVQFSIENNPSRLTITGMDLKKLCLILWQPYSGRQPVASVSYLDSAGAALMKSTLFALLSLMYAVDALADTPNVSTRIDYGAVTGCDILGNVGIVLADFDVSLTG